MERPIIFSGLMAQAIVAGRKTQTRRVVKPQPYIVNHGRFTAWRWDHGPGEAYTTWKTDLAPMTFVGMACERRPCPYGMSGDRLWVREAFSAWFGGNHWRDVVRREQAYCSNLFYRATHPYPDDDQKWVPSIHMPRWASRITLEITSVRVERLQEISEADAQAEGVGPGFVPCPHEKYPDMQTTRCVGYRPMFKRIWNEINGKRGFGWDVNPWVWVIEFKPMRTI